MANLGYLLIAAIAVVGVVAHFAKRPGEPFMDAVDRLLNNDEHKEREARRRAGLEEKPDA